jgi:hypothetical protein
MLRVGSPSPLAELLMSPPDGEHIKGQKDGRNDTGVRTSGRHCKRSGSLAMFAAGGSEGASSLNPARALVVRLLASQPVSFSVERAQTLSIGHQNDTADNHQNYSCKFGKGERFTDQKPDHHRGCDSPGNTDGSTNRDR